MTRRLATLFACMALPPLAAAEILTVDRLFEAPDLRGTVLGSVRFSPDGRLVSYLRGRADDQNVQDLWAYDVARDQHRLLADARNLVPQERALAPEEEARRERARIASARGIVEYTWAPDSRALLFPLNGDLYWYDLRQPPGSAVRQLTDTEAYETDARISPRGRFVSFVRDQDLFVLELATGCERALTDDGVDLISNGVAEFIAQEEMGRDTGYWWSPDESRIAYARVDASGIEEQERFEIEADDIKVYRQRYPAAGTANATVALGVVELEGGTVHWLDLGADTDVYLARVDWFPAGDRVLVQRQSRDQKRLDLLSYPAGGGAPRLLLSERSETWVDLHDDLLFVPGRGQFVWASMRSGHSHLYLFDEDGALLRPLTAGDWDVEGDRDEAAVRGFDDRSGRLYFMATRKSPLERHLYVVELDTTEPESPRQLTSGDGWNSVVMSGDAQRFVTTYSDPAHPAEVTLRDTDGRRLATIAANALDASHPYWPYAAAHVTPEFGTLPAADGTRLHWQLHRPAGFDATRRYPVIVMVYGGPGVQQVQRRWGDRRGRHFEQLLAQRGYAVFTLDNRGSAARGRAFAEVLAGRLGRVEVEDQLRGVEFLKSLPWVDPERMGVFGWSYGGYMVLKMMVQAPEAFRAGVAGAPVTDWRLYDTHYTERYLGRPQDNAAGYEASSVLPYAAALRGRLLVMHGMADDNVLFTHSTRLIHRLTELDKSFEVMPYPGARHAALSFRTTGRHGWKTILDFFDRQLAGPPQESPAAAAGDRSVGGAP